MRFARYAADRGVATSLLQVLFEYARAQGVSRVHCYILAQNRRMIDLARDLGLSISRTAGDGAMVTSFRNL
jgi:RimJ/RimL family protein N-acetyltransferase